MNQFKDHYFFIHLPKSAGTSLLECLRAALGKAKVLHVHKPGAPEDGPLEQLITRYRAVAGHFLVFQLSPWMFENVFMFTFLRNPIERVLSNYYFYRNVPNHKLSPDVKLAQTKDLKSLLQSCDRSRLNAWSNWQTYALSGVKPADFAPGSILEPAKRTLDRLDFVGFYESLAADVKRLSDLCGWPSEFAIPHLNATPDRAARDDLDAETIELLQDLNRDDFELYEYAKSLPEKPPPTIHPQDIAGAIDVSSQPLALMRSERGSKEIVFRHVAVRGVRSATALIEQDDRMEIRLEGESAIACPDLVAGIRITNAQGLHLYGTNSLLLGRPIPVKTGQRFTITFSCGVPLSPETYYLTIALHSGQDREFHWIDNHSVFQILPARTKTFTGLFDLKAKMEMQFAVNAPPAVDVETVCPPVS